MEDLIRLASVVLASLIGGPAGFFVCVGLDAAGTPLGVAIPAGMAISILVMVAMIATMTKE